jgi:hypothetical protein
MREFLISSLGIFVIITSIALDRFEESSKQKTSNTLETIKDSYTQNLNDLYSNVIELDVLASKYVYDEVDINQLQTSILKTRNTFKKVEYLLEYSCL